MRSPQCSRRTSNERAAGASQFAQPPVAPTQGANASVDPYRDDATDELVVMNGCIGVGARVALEHMTLVGVTSVAVDEHGSEVVAAGPHLPAARPCGGHDEHGRERPVFYEGC